MRKALISCIYDPYKSPKRPPTRNYSLILKISIICLLFFFWFILETHKSVDVTAHKYLGKKDVRSFWREHNALNSFQEENPLLKNEKLKGCGSGLEICPGNRPRSTENCKCRAQAWEECGYNIGKECDNQLGLQCTNTTCVGQYHLKVVQISQNSIRLTWDDFKPNDYLYEYVLLRSSHFTENLEFWRMESIGNEPKTLVTHLQANHGYFFRVATWDDPSHDKYGKVSETVFIKTTAGCHHEGKWYKVDEILKVKCEEKCRCKANGNFACEQLCPEEKPSPEMKDPNFKCSKELIKPSGCCYKIICVPIDGSCLVNGSRVADGTVFNTTCSECTCKTGRLNCTMKVECPSTPTDLWCENPVENVTSGSCCASWNCHQNCFYNNKTYRNGNIWRQNCDEQCVCLQGNVQCRPICKTITEQMRSEDCLSLDKSFKGGDGCCTVVECLPKDECYFGRNKTHTESKMFYSPDCKICICRWNRQKVCHQLFCPDLPKLTPNPICLDPQVHPGQCCTVLYCHQPSTVSPNAIQNLTAKASGSNSIFLTFQAPSNSHLLNYTHGYDVQYKRKIKFIREDWTTLTTQPVALNGKPNSSSSTTIMVNDLEVNVTYLFRVRIHLDWKRARRFFGEDKKRTMTYEQESNIEMTLDLTESIPLADTKVPPESIIPFSFTVSAQTFIQSDCVYKEKTLKLGEESEDNCEKYCKCEIDGLSCHPVCLQIIKKPRENCLTTSLPIDCCLSWICQPERRPFRAVSMMVNFELEGSCWAPERKFTDDVIEGIRTKVEEGSSRVCGGTATGCPTIDVQVTCANATGNYANGAVRRRNVRICIKWTVGQENSYTFDADGRQLKRFVQDIGKQFVSKDFRILVQGISYGPSLNWQVSRLIWECEQGFTKTHSDCVETHPIYRSSPAKIDSKFHAEEITYDSAVLKWRPLNQLKGQYSGNISIAFKQSENSGKWIWSKSLNASTVSYVLSNLLPGRKYNVKMVWQAKMFGVNDFPLTTTSISTKKIPELSILVENNELHEMFLLVTWERLQDEIRTHLETLELAYQKPGTEKWLSDRVPNPTVTISQKIGVLKRPGNYTVRLTGHLKNGTKINILPSHIRIIQVMPSHSKQRSVLTGVVVSVCLVLVIAFIAVIFWRRRSRRRSSNSGYENKTFGLQLSESRRCSTSHLRL